MLRATFYSITSLKPSRWSSGALRHFTTAAQSKLSPSVTINGIEYQVPSSPTIAFIIDGCAPEYLNEACKRDRMPYYHDIIRKPFMPTSTQSTANLFSFASTRGIVSAIVPTYTNPNNAAIVCGANAITTGITGNFYYDTESQKEVSMTNGELLRCPTILAELARQGVPITIITVKDKLLSLLSKGLRDANANFRAISIETLANFNHSSSSEDRSQNVGESVGEAITKLEALNKKGSFYIEHAHQFFDILLKLQMQQVLIPRDIYNAECNLFAMQLAYEFLRRDTMSSVTNGIYLVSTTDYLQHSYAPHAEEALRFYEAFDSVLNNFSQISNAVVGFTADHGMNDKCGFDGNIKVVYLSTELEKLGVKGRVLLPITDPHTVHHGCLGSYATIHIDRTENETEVQHRSRVLVVMQQLRVLAGVYTVLSREEAVRAFELPGDRIGDIIVVSHNDTVLGKSEEFHRKGIEQLREERLKNGELNGNALLRSHGGLDEMTVPMFVNRPLRAEYQRRLSTGKLRNYHLFDLLLNAAIR